MIKKSEKNAIILAAGVGLRTIPINNEQPKALLEVHGEVLIERLIRQLREAGVAEIVVVVGYMKEQLSYLAEKFQVKLIDNDQFGSTNNLHSLFLAKDFIYNTFILPCDVWLKENIFLSSSNQAWYLLSKHRQTLEKKLAKDYWQDMLSIAFISSVEAEWFNKQLTLFHEQGNLNTFWEEALYEDHHFLLPIQYDESFAVHEIDTYEDLRVLDNQSITLKSDAIDIICQSLKVESQEISDITALKKGMTNRSFLFSIDEKQYIMRIPGEGTDQLINRRQEASVYGVIKDLNLCDPLVYINPTNGYKITEFLQNTKVCDATNWSDVRLCMNRLREFHNLGLTVEHEFDLFEQIDFYESLRKSESSMFDDYAEVKQSIYSFKSFIDSQVKQKVLSHIDAIPDNFLILKEDGTDEIRLIDWEYAGMQDPHVDIVMFAIYSGYDQNEIDKLINCYFSEGCSTNTRLKIYAYVAICGLLWSNWCEYKRTLGVDFGEYALSQYQYAKDYSVLVRQELEK